MTNIRIQEEWSRTRLKNIAEINARSLSATTADDYTLRYLEISNVNNRGIISEAAVEELSYIDAPSRAKRIVQSGDTVISSVRPNLQAVAHIDQASGNFIASTGFYVVSPNQNSLNAKYTYYLLLSEDTKQYLEAVAKGVGYPAVDDKDFITIKFLLPSIDNQRRIVAYLDKTCESIDRAIAAKQKQLGTLDALRKSIIHKAVTRGLDDSVELKDSELEWLGDLPIAWKVTRLKDVARIRYGLGQPPQEKEDGIPMIRATNIDAGHIIEQGLLRVDPEALPLERDPYLAEDDIIVVRSGAYTGDSAIIPSKYVGAVAGYDMVVTAKKADSKFVSYALLSSYVLDGQLLLMTLRAAQPHLNAEELGSILICLPKTITEQKEIALYIETKLKQIDKVETNLSAQIATLQQYRKSLIHECVAGKRRITEDDMNRVQQY